MGAEAGIRQMRFSVSEGICCPRGSGAQRPPSLERGPSWMPGAGHCSSANLTSGARWISPGSLPTSNASAHQTKPGRERMWSRELFFFFFKENPQEERREVGGSRAARSPFSFLKGGCCLTPKSLVPSLKLLPAASPNFMRTSEAAHLPAGSGHMETISVMDRRGGLRGRGGHLLPSCPGLRRQRGNLRVPGVGAPIPNPPCGRAGEAACELRLGKVWVVIAKIGGRSDYVLAS